MKKNTINICAVGLEIQFEKMLHWVFEHKANNFVLSSEENADACIFDFDSLHAKERWHTYRKHYPHLPAIILSLHDNVPEKQFFIKKPAELDQFINVLHKLEKVVIQNRRSLPIKNDLPPPKEELILRIRSSEKKSLHQANKTFGNEQLKTLSNYAESSVCGFESDINPQDEQAVLKVSYERSRRLQGLIEKSLETAKNSGCVNRLKGTMGELLLDPLNQRVLCGVKEQTLNSLMLLPAKNLAIETQLLSPNQAKEYIKTSNIPFHYEKLDAFLWKVAILTAHGRVPTGTDLNAPVILMRWANFTRLMITPYALQINALWSDSPYSLIETAALLKIPQRYVFSLYSAMFALNLACVTSNISPHKKRTLSTISPEKRGLFQRLLAKLSF
ncbi:MAG: hypothetical protein RIT27_447 [Pseudomonadota bacterium]|jgi:hypothetical protein